MNNRNINKLNQRQLRILRQLLESPNRYLTSALLAKDHAVTTRTIKNDIYTIRDYLGEQSDLIVTKPSRGFCFSPSSDDQIKTITYMIGSGSNFGDTRSGKRQLAFSAEEWILLREEWFTLNELAEHLGTSLSVVNRIMPEVKNNFEHYGIRLITSTHHGLKVDASELAIRAALIDHCIESSSVLDRLPLPKGKPDLEEVSKTLDTYLRKENLVLADFALNRFALSYIVCISRRPHKIPEKEIDFEEERNPAFSLILQLEKARKIVLNSQDRKYLTLCLLSLLTITGEEILESYYHDFIDSGKMIADDLIRNTSQYGIIFNEEMKGYILNSMIKALILKKLNQYQLLITRGLRAYARTQQVALDLAYRSARFLHEKYGFIMSRNLLYTLTIGYCSFFYQQDNTKERKVFVVPNYDSYYSIKVFGRISYLMGMFSGYEITGRYDPNDKDSIYVVIDNGELKADNIINVDYRSTRREVMEKTLKIIGGGEEALQFDKEIVIEKKISKKELFEFVTTLFCDDLAERKKTLEYISERDRFISYDNPIDRTAVIPLMHQEREGIVRIWFRHMIRFNNWEMDNVIVLSSNNNNTLLRKYATASRENLE